MTETEKVQEVKRPIPDEMSQAAAVEIFGLLSRPMPAEALSIDGSRGFPLTSIKAGFILERLNQTFGLLGYGWRYAVGPFHLETAGGKEEILVEVAIQWRTSETLAEVYCPPIYWQRKTDPETGITTQGWCPEKTLPRCWSEPIVATGGSSAKRTGSVPLTDARRSAVTNAITKAMPLPRQSGSAPGVSVNLVPPRPNRPGHPRRPLMDILTWRLCGPQPGWSGPS